MRGRETQRFSRAVWTAIAALLVLLIMGMVNLGNAAAYTGETFYKI